MTKKGSGRRLAAARERVGLSAAEVCRRSGISPSEYSRWEGGEREVPRTERARKSLAKALQRDYVAVSDYLDGATRLEELFPPPPPPPTSLDLALAIEGRPKWMPSSIELAKALAAKGIELPVYGWVRALSEIDKEQRSTFKNRYEWIMQGGVVPDDED